MALFLLSGSKIRILVAEDDVPGYILIEEMLKETGADLVHAANGEEVVDLAGKFEFDLVRMDINMPVLDGLEATRKIKAMKPGLLVVAVSAHAFISEQDKALEAGCERYITKPVQSTQICLKL